MTGLPSSSTTLHPVRIELPRPPVAPEPAAFPLLACLAPVVGAGAMFLLLQTPTVLIFALLGPVMAVASMGDGRRTRRRQRAREEARWRAEVAETEGRIDAALDARRAALTLATPGSRSVAARPAHDPHRWRRGSDAPVPVVLGTGALASGVTVEGTVSTTDPAAVRVGAADDAERLRAAAAVFEGPVVVDARDGIGIVAPPLVALAIARSVVVQVADAVAPDRAEAIVPAGPEWDWLDALPHPVHRERGSSVRFVGDDVEVTVAVADDAARLPRECRIVVHASLDHARVVHERTGATAQPCRPHALAAREAVAAIETLADAAEHAGMGRGNAVPAHVDLAALPQASGGLAAVFLSAEKPVTLDLVRDGPHAVVGGTTGSGKSELLIAWVAAMAAGRSSNEVSFLLVDFKGGASFAPLADLAHVVGVMTDLDESGSRRAIESLRAELRRRERLLAEQGARSIEEAVGVPRLVIVVDEFAAMLAELPDLYRLFVDLAARGRSLGVHLVLCTQRPAEAVRDSLLANCGIRISLRVTEEHDAVAVTGEPDAARIPLTARGRCVVRVAGGATRTAQAALADPAHLRALVSVSADLPRVPRPWREPLPEQLSLPAATEAGTHREGAVVLGLVDRPSLQRVDAVSWHPAADGPLLAIGGVSSGRSSLASLVASQLGTEVVDREDALWDALQDRGPIVVDDLDLQLARLSEEHQAAAVQALARRMREGAPVALTARRISTPMGQLASLAEQRIVLRIASKQEHVVAGGAAQLHDASLPAGAGWLHDERIQLALPDARVGRRAALCADLPEGPLAVLLGPGAVLTPELLSRGPETSPGAGDGPMVVGTIPEWEAAWGELDRLRATRPVVVLGADERQVRQVLRHLPLPPPMRTAPAWLLTAGRFARLRIESAGGIERD